MKTIQRYVFSNINNPEFLYALRGPLLAKAVTIYFVNLWAILWLAFIRQDAWDHKTVPILKTQPPQNAVCSLTGCHEQWNADGFHGIGPREFAYRS